MSSAVPPSDRVLEWISLQHMVMTAHIDRTLALPELTRSTDDLVALTLDQRQWATHREKLAKRARTEIMTAYEVSVRRDTSAPFRVWADLWLPYAADRAYATEWLSETVLGMWEQIVEKTTDVDVRANAQALLIRIIERGLGAPWMKWTCDLLARMGTSEDATRLLEQSETVARSGEGAAPDLGAIVRRLIDQGAPREPLERILYLGASPALLQQLLDSGVPQHIIDVLARYAADREQAGTARPEDAQADSARTQRRHGGAGPND